MVYASKWKNKNCFFLENDTIRAAVLPDLGGKIASLFYKPCGLELAAQSGGDYTSPPHGASFDMYDASGIDDVFPAVTPSLQHINEKTVAYPDHGEVWTESFACVVRDEIVDLSFSSHILPYHYRKTIHLEKNRLFLDYGIKNTGDYSFPFIWLFHGLFRYEEDMTLFYPPDTKGFVYVYGGPGIPGQRHAAGEACFSTVPGRESSCAMKYYVDGPVSTGICGCCYPWHRLKLRLFFDPVILPYLGFWITTGGFRGDYNCAFEPSSGFYDDIEIARQNNALSHLGPGELMRFSLVIDLAALPPG
jgi:hypothetical protein